MAAIRSDVQSATYGRVHLHEVLPVANESHLDQMLPDAVKQGIGAVG